ncbi:GGDEF domain-containing protein, partial [Bariatricus massiliensis]|uniref:GGDEF domain-containing protein n=1 Tax=Bariatricus massiliensis TaxID=1745713 RepID=UPI00210DB2E0
MRKSSVKVTCLIMDLDNFKQINDTFGHLEVDRVLQSLADSIRNIFRNDDFAVLIGGDEFLVYMKQA